MVCRNCWVEKPKKDMHVVVTAVALLGVGVRGGRPASSDTILGDDTMRPLISFLDITENTAGRFEF